MRVADAAVPFPPHFSNHFPLANSPIVQSFQTQVDETADVSPTLETIACCNYPTPQARLRNRTQEADGSIPFISTISFGFVGFWFYSLHGG